MDIAAVRDLTLSVGTACTHVPRLHAKAYVADNSLALVTSANLTHGGMYRNEEYGVLLRDPASVAEIRAHFTLLAGTGVPLPGDRLAALAAEHSPTYRKAEREATAGLERLVRADLDAYDDGLREARAATGSTTGLFARAVLQALRLRGPLTTPDLNAEVQELVPDLCDDAIDRVINGVHFGKRWKHYVRSAQQSLKRSGEIERLEGGVWRATPGD